MWNLKKPCSNCPFRKSAFKGWLGEKRAREIIDGITGDRHESFTCHKTNDGGEITDESQHCAGAAILLHKTRQPNMAMRYGYVYKVFDGAKLKNQNEVFETAEDFINHHAGRKAMK